MAPFKPPQPPQNPFSPQIPTSLTNTRRKVNEAGYANQLEREREGNTQHQMTLQELLAFFRRPPKK